MINTLIYGASDLGCSVASMVSKDESFCILGFLDDSLKTPKHKSDFTVLGSASTLSDHNPDTKIIVCIGDNGSREKISLLIRDSGYTAIGYLHPKAFVANSASVHNTAIIFPFAYIGESCEVDAFSIVHPNATLSSHSKVSDYCLLAPNCAVGSGALLGKGVSVGLSSSILPGLNIGETAKVAAGAAVVKNVPNNSVAKGVPAKW